MDKKQARAHFRALRDSFSSEDFDRWNEQIFTQLKNFLQNLNLPKNDKIYLAAYRARKNEASIDALWQAIQSKQANTNLIWSFPRLLSSSGEMEFCAALEASDFILNNFGILEPRAECAKVEKKNIHLCFVPFLSVDAEGNRLGHGKGYYDRFLKDFSGLKVGVGFEWQFSQSLLPHDDHDISLDFVITEKKVRHFT